MNLNRSTGCRQINDITAFFNYNMEDNKASCRIKNCKYSCKIHIGNQTGHVQTAHSKICRQYHKHQNAAVCSNSSTNNRDIKKLEVQTLHNVSLNQQKIKEAVLKLVTVNGRSFSLFDDSGMRMLLDPLLECLPPCDLIAVTPQSVETIVCESADSIKHIIKSEVRGVKMVCIKLDIAKKHGRSFLALNIQFISKGELIIRTLRVVEITAKYFSGNLKDFILNILESYDISVSKNLYSFIYTDATKLGKLHTLIDEQYDDFITTQPEPSKQEIISDLVIETKENVMNNKNIKDEEEGQIMNLIEICSQYLMSCCNHITNVQCATPILDLAIEKVIKKTKLADFLIKARMAVIYFRQDSILNSIREEIPSIEKPMVDIPNYWRSTYEMLRTLLGSYMDFSSQVPFVTEEHWNDIYKYIMALRPAINVAKKLDSEQMLIPEFYCALLMCIEETENIGTPLAKDIAAAIKEGGRILMQNETFLAALFLDPLVNATLDKEQKRIAIDHLCQIWERLSCINAESQSKIEQPMMHEDISSGGRIASVIEDALHKRKRARFEKTKKTDMMLMLEDFYNDQERATNVVLLEYWEWNKYIMRELYQIAMIVLATPITQVSAGRLFFGLDYICSDSSDKLNEETLDSILIVRTNYNILSNK